MKASWLEIVRCTQCSGTLKILNGEVEDDVLAQGTLQCQVCNTTFAVVDEIPRFVPRDNYAASFGLQWNHFRETQLDSHNGLTISKDRFLSQSGWSQKDLDGRTILDAGCGSGRFAEIALSMGAVVYAIDYSSAIDACWRNLKSHPRLRVFQADIFRLPFAKGAFDFIYSFGVLQHTPDVERAVKSLPPFLSPGGKIAVDIYEKSYKALFHPKYWLRPVTRRVPNETLFDAIQFAAPRLMSVSDRVGSLPLVGRYLQRLIPVANYRGRFPLSEQQLQEYAVLDTFDWFSPAHDHPQTGETIRSWLHDAGIAELEVVKPAHLTIRGRKTTFQS